MLFFMPRGFKCFIRIFKTDDKNIEEAFNKAMKQIYKGKENVPTGTYIEITEWKDTPQIEILGVGEDDRCAFCNYFCQIIGEDKVKRTNCPF